jgi:predicted nuclease with TOPRIM domain
MGRYATSISDTRDLSKSLKELESEFKTHREVVDKNNKELASLNHAVEKAKEADVKLKAKKLEDLQNEIQWVKNDEPAIKVNPEHMLKKLDIL